MITLIKLLVLDFDGVLTDNHVLVDSDGKEYVRCYRSDGIGIARAMRRGITVIVVSSESNAVVRERCKKLGIACHTSVGDKLDLLKKLLRSMNLSAKKVCYVGNDLPDIPCMKFVGLSIAVHDAYEEVKSVANYTTKKKGGHGAVREICDLLVK